MDFLCWVYYYGALLWLSKHFQFLFYYFSTNIHIGTPNTQMHQAALTHALIYLA